MKKTLSLSLIAGLLAAVTSHASVTLTFNTDLQGFQSGGGGGTFGWSSVNGGSMALTNNSGWHGDMVKLQLSDFPMLWAEIQSAQTNGGTLEFDMVVRESDQGYTGSSSVQLIVVGNSDLGGWKDNNVGWTALPVSGGAVTNHITLPIATSGASQDGKFVVAGAWGNLQIGLNNGGTVSSGVVLIDNVKFTAATPADITFDTDLQGFQSGGGGGTFGWSSANGGSMALTNNAGWHGDMVKLQLADFPALWAKLQTAQVNGGNLEFDVIARESDQAYTAGTNAWLQLIVVGNSDTGGWKQNFVAWTGLPVSGGAVTNHVSLPIATSGASENGYFIVAGNWANLQFGLNNGSDVSSGVLYIDNVKISPNAASTNIQPILWKDADPQVASATSVDSALGVTSGQADPAGGTNTVGVVYYTGTHAEYRNIGMQGGANASGAGYELQKPLGGGYQWANLNSNYFGGQFVLSFEVYVPAASAIGADAGDDITAFVRQTDGSGGFNFATDHFYQTVNLAQRDQWQTVAITNWISTTNPALARVVAAIGVHDDPATEIPASAAVFYLRNINFRLDPPSAVVTPPVIQLTSGSGNVTLNWTASGFKLQAKTNSLTAGSWADYSLPAGTNPPVIVPINVANGAVFFRLAPQ